MKRIASVAVLALVAVPLLCVSRGRREAEAPLPASGDGAAARPTAGFPEPGPGPEPATETARREIAADSPADPQETSAPITGRVVDDVTGEPVPSWRFTLLSGGERLEDLATDAAGRFRTRSALPAGDYAVETVGEHDPRDLIQSSGRSVRGRPVHVLTHVLDEPVELAVPVGPTWQLRVLAPPEVVPDELEASLRSADGRFAFDRAHADVRASGPPWVRFGPLARELGGGPTFALELATKDGLWRGGAEVEGLTGIRPGVVEVELSARGTVRGTVVRADGTPLASSFAQLWGDGASFQAPANRPLFALTDEDGRYHHRWVVPGTYTLKFQAAGHEPFAAEVVVAAGEETPLDARLAESEAPGDGRLAGRVVSRTGTFRGPLQVALSPLDGGAAAAVGVVWEERDGVWTGAFAFEDVAREEHELRPVRSGLLLVRPRTQRVTPDRSDLELVVEDGSEPAAIHVRAVDAETGDAVPAFRAWITVEVGTERERLAFARAEGGVARFEGAPRGVPYELRVDGDGYANAWAEGETPAAAAGALEVELRRGWSTMLAVDGPDDEPLAGASVFLDDELAGLTDARGRLVVYRGEEPGRLRVEYRDWEMVATSVFDPATGRFRGWQPWNRVQMRPPDG